MLKVSLSFREQITDARSSSTKSLITKAKTYVESHYREEGLSLDDICEELGVSNSYFSSMFKRDWKFCGLSDRVSYGKSM